MGTMVQPWIMKRLNELNMDDTKKKAIMVRLIALAAKGKSLGKKLHRSKNSTDPDYKDWGFYGACQACDAVQSVAQTLKQK